MSIERLIYGSFPLGIENDSPGYQELTYTKGYPDLRDANKDIHGRIITTYAAPQTICYTDWYVTKISEEMASGIEQIKIANEASRMSTKDHPASLTYYQVKVNDENKSVFVYGKGMLDWSMRGGIASYHSAVICDPEDVTRYPILFCSSPIVCCDILREDLFPNDGKKIQAPSLLKNLTTLEGQNDLQIRHTAGFKSITQADVISFIRKDNNISILKNMISSIIQLKEGDTSKRIVIADKCENVSLWIAAISYVFPLTSSIKISFSTYSYSVKDLDITGVYLEDLNGAKRIADDIEVTEYDFNKLNPMYSVYDFSRQRFGENVEEYDNLFISLVETSFTISEQILEQYKDYIITTTTYDMMNKDYMDGSILFMFMMKNKKLKGSQLLSALSFALKYSIKSEQRKVVDKLLQVYREYLSVSETKDGIINYLRFCVEKGIVPQSKIEDIFFKRFIESFIDCNNYSFDMVSEQGSIVEQICGYAEGELEISLINSLGFDTILKQLDEFKKKRDVERISYIHTSLAHYVSSRKGSYKKGQPERLIENKVLDVFINGESGDNSKRLSTLNKKTEQIIAETMPLFYYYDAVFNFLIMKNYTGLAKEIAVNIAEKYSYLSTDEQPDYISAIGKSDQSEVYMNFILSKIKEEYNYSERINKLSKMISKNPREFEPYLSEIKRICLSTEDDSVSSDYYNNVLLFSENCEKLYGSPLNSSNISNIIKSYLNCLYNEHRDLVLSSEKFSELKDILKEYDILEKDDSSANLAYLLLIVYEMSKNIKTKGNNVFSGSNPYEPVFYDTLSSKQQQSLIYTYSKLISEYWLNTKSLPDFQSIVAAKDDYGDIELYCLLFGEILDNVIESKSKNRTAVMVAIIEYAIYLRLDNFLNVVPDMLVDDVKSNDILKPLEKELEIRTTSNVHKGLLAEIEVRELQQIVTEIRGAYELKVQSSPFGRAKQAIENLMNGFKKGKNN